MDKKTAKQFADALACANTAATDKIPEGWHTTDEVAVMIGKSVSHANKLLRGAVEKGEVKAQSFRILRGNRTLPVTHYRLKK